MDDVLDKLAASPAQITVHPMHTADAVCGLAGVLIDEGFPVIEILGRPLEDAVPLLRALNEMPQRSEIGTAIGTLKTRQQAEVAAELGPDLFVSPAFSQEVLDVAHERNIAYLPSITTLQDIQNIIGAFERVGREVNVLKVCPATLITREILNSYAGIFPGILFCPTGTIQKEEIPDWKAMPWMGAPMERWFVPDELLENHDWDGVRKALQEVKDLAAEGLARR